MYKFEYFTVQDIVLKMSKIHGSISSQTYLVKPRSYTTLSLKNLHWDGYKRNDCRACYLIINSSDHCLAHSTTVCNLKISPQKTPKLYLTSVSRHVLRIRTEHLGSDGMWGTINKTYLFTQTYMHQIKVMAIQRWDEFQRG